jgi:hypothetical protein
MKKNKSNQRNINLTKGNSTNHFFQRMHCLLKHKILQFVLIKMHGGTTIKIIDAQQAKLRNKYKNTKLKLLKTNAAIWFNKKL